MPEFSLPFDSIAGDEREYPAEQFVQYLKPLVNTGIHTDPDTLKVEHVNGMTVQVNTGYAWIEGYVYSLYDVPLQLTLEQEQGSLDRIDRIVVRLDLTLPVRSINVKILKGEPSSNPEPPALTRDANVYELSLAQVRVVAGQNFIDPANIIDERGDEELCPFITSNILPDITDALQDVIDMVEERIPLDQKGAPGGVATLDDERQVPKEQLLKAPRIEILFGNGMDGDVTISSNTTLTRDMYYNNLTINSGQTLKTNGYKIFVKGTLINNGTIDNSGGNGGNGQSNTPGEGGRAGVGGGDGGDGGYSSSANDGRDAVGGGLGGRGGAHEESTSYPSYGRGGIAEFTMSHRASFELLHNLYDVTIGGGGGGGGGQRDGSYAGGGGGGGGGRIHIYAKEIINNGYIRADGGNGGNGYNGGGGGGGGGGGFVLLVYENATFSREPSVKGGSRGAISNPQFPPTNGEDGRVIKIKLI